MCPIRAFLEEASNPQNVDALSCPIKPCLRQLRPLLVKAQHLLDEVCTKAIFTSSTISTPEWWKYLAFCQGSSICRSLFQNPPL